MEKTITLNKKRVLNNTLKAGSNNLNSENWAVYHPNGKHMFTCGEKKAKWYLDRDLAFINDENKITLTFTPKGDGYKDDEIFGKSIRKTICVVSGKSYGLQRHHIVPYCYRTHFPPEFKSKNHHDVVLINHKIHSDYERIASDYKDEIAKIYGIGTISELNTKYTKLLRDSSSTYGIPMNLLNSIFNSFGLISEETKIDKLKQISKHTKIPFNKLCSYNYIQLYSIYRYLKEKHEIEKERVRNKNRNDYDHGYQLSLKLDTDDKIEEFIKLWRKHFINTMKPKYMPTGWSVDFKFKTKL